MKTKILLLIILLISITDFICAQQKYSSKDLEYAQKAIEKNDEWYADRISDPDLKNATKAHMKKDEWYTNRIKDEDLKNAANASIKKDDWYTNRIKNSDLKNVVESFTKGKEIRDSDLRNVKRSLEKKDEPYTKEEINTTPSEEYEYSSFNYTGGRSYVDWDNVFYNKYGKYRRRFNIQAGAWIPMGNLKDAFLTGLHLGLRYAFPIVNDNNYIDFGTSFVLPRSNKPFEFYDASYTSSTSGDELDRYYTTKVALLWDLNIWYRYKQNITNTIYWNRYIGMGYDMLFTDRKSTSNSRLKTGSLSFKCGTDFCYQAIGVFVEFNYIFYNRLEELPDHFGGAIFIAGLNIRI